MSEISKSERLLNLVAFLLKARRPVSFAELREKVIGYAESKAEKESLERRFARDKAALRELGVPLKFVQDEDEGGPGYMIPQDAYFLPRIELTPPEAALLSSAGHFAIAGAAGPISDAMQSALRKLQFDAPIPGAIRETPEERVLFHRGGASDEAHEHDVLRDLTSAILERRSVTFAYYGIGRNREETRTVNPYGIGFSGGHWYLAGFDHVRKDVRVFRTDRIRGAVKRARPAATGPEFDVPDGFHIQDHVGVPPWLFGKATRTEVRIELDADVAFIVQMHPAPGDRWEKRLDGSAVLTRQATNLDALLDWVLGFGHHAVVLDPPEFRQRIIDALEDCIRRHEARAKGGRQ